MMIKQESVPNKTLTTPKSNRTPTKHSKKKTLVSRFHSWVIRVLHNIGESIMNLWENIKHPLSYTSMNNQLQHLKKEVATLETDIKKKGVIIHDFSEKYNIAATGIDSANNILQQTKEKLTITENKLQSAQNSLKTSDDNLTQAKANISDFHETITDSKNSLAILCSAIIKISSSSYPDLMMHLDQEIIRSKTYIDQNESLQQAHIERVQIQVELVKHHLTMASEFHYSMLTEKTLPKINPPESITRSQNTVSTRELSKILQVCNTLTQSKISISDFRKWIIDNKLLALDKCEDSNSSINPSIQYSNFIRMLDEEYGMTFLDNVIRNLVDVNPREEVIPSAPYLNHIEISTEGNDSVT